MKGGRVAITLTFFADLDPVPGWGDNSGDWINLIKSDLERNSHYNTEVVIHEIINANYAYEEGKGYVKPPITTVVDRLTAIKRIQVGANSEPELMGQALEKINKLAWGIKSPSTTETETV